MSPSELPKSISANGLVLGILMLFLLLEGLGIMLTILFLIVWQPPQTQGDVEMILRAIPQVIGQIFRPTAIPTLLYAILLVFAGFRLNRHKGFKSVLVLSAGLACFFVLASIPLAVWMVGDWDDLLRMVEHEPMFLALMMGVAMGIAVVTGIVSALVMRQFFRVLDRRGSEA